MFSVGKVRELVDAVLEEEALVIGGRAALGEIEDEEVERLVETLEEVRDGILGSLDLDRPSGHGRDAGNPRPHPAVERFLGELRGD